MQQSATIRVREEDGPVVFGALCGHCEWVVGELVVAGRFRSDEDGVGTSPLLPVDDWSESPRSVGVVADGQLSALFGSDSGGEMESLDTQEGI